jgi:hypothetical protein
MGLQAGVFANEHGMKLARRAYQKAIPGFFFVGSQYQDQSSEKVYSLAPKHRFLKEGRLSFRWLQEPLKRGFALDFRFHQSTTALGDKGAVNILDNLLALLSVIQRRKSRYSLINTTPPTTLSTHSVGYNIDRTSLVREI